MEATEKARKDLHIALDIGAQMLSSGAEIERVEDSIERLCRAFGAETVESFAITYVIAVTISGKDFDGITEIRRISQFDRNLEKLSQLNALSREICEKHLASEEAEQKLKAICEGKGYHLVQLMFIYALISSAFTVFFGGTFRDAVFSAAIGVLIAPVDKFLNRLQINRFVCVCICSVCAGALAMLCVTLFPGISADYISIGNIMIFIPGVIFTCAIQEIFSNNMLSGFTRMVEAIMLSVVIASGFVFVKLLF